MCWCITLFLGIDCSYTIRVYIEFKFLWITVLKYLYLQGPTHVILIFSLENGDSRVPCLQRNMGGWLQTDTYQLHSYVLAYHYLFFNFLVHSCLSCMSRRSVYTSLAIFGKIGWTQKLQQCHFQHMLRRNEHM